MSNASLSTLQQGITVILAFMGVIVAWRPPKKGTAQEHMLILAFIVLGGIGVYATYIQGARLDVASVQQRLQLDAIQKNTEQTPRVVVENTIDPKTISDAVQQGMQPNQTERETERANRLLKDKTFTVATDILTFLSDREKSRPKVELLPHGDEGPGPYKSRTDRELKEYNEHENDTGKMFQDRYWQRTLPVLIELKLRGFSAESVWYQPVSPEQIREFAIGLADVAEKVPTR
jgi:hypothetical protein